MEVWHKFEKPGNRSNNKESNCQTLCPNCHAIKTRSRREEEVDKDLSLHTLLLPLSNNQQCVLLFSFLCTYVCIYLSSMFSLVCQLNKYMNK